MGDLVEPPDHGVIAGNPPFVLRLGDERLVSMPVTAASSESPPSSRKDAITLLSVWAGTTSP